MFQQPRYSVAKDRYRKKSWEDDQLKATDNYVKAGGSGALIGSLLRNKGTSVKKAAAIGAAAGVGAQMLVRRVTGGTTDQFGERSHAGKRVDGALPLAGEVGGAVLGYRMAAKKMKRFGFSEGPAGVGKIVRNANWGRIGRSAAVGAAALGGAGAVAGALAPDKGSTSGQSAASGLVKDGIFGAALYGAGEPIFKKALLRKGESLLSAKEDGSHKSYKTYTTHKTYHQFGYQDQVRDKRSQRWADPLDSWSKARPVTAGTGGREVDISNRQILHGAFRNGRKLVTGVNRGSALASDAVGALSGKQKLDSRGRPLKKEWEKTWFKNAATGAALGVGVLGVHGVKRYAKKNPESPLGKKVRNAEAVIYKTKRRVENAAENAVGKVARHFKLSANNSESLRLMRVDSLLQFISQNSSEEEDQPSLAGGLAKTALIGAGAVGAGLLARRFVRGSGAKVAEGVEKEIPSSSAAALQKMAADLRGVSAPAVEGQLAKGVGREAASPTPASPQRVESYNGSGTTWGKLPHSLKNEILDHVEKGNLAEYRRLKELHGFASALDLISFDIHAAVNGWDVRDPRGRSARVFAPGSRQRARREKVWHEKVDNIRRIAVVGGVAAGALGLAGGYALGKRFGKPSGSPVIKKVKKAAVKAATPSNIVPSGIGKMAMSSGASAIAFGSRVIRSGKMAGQVVKWGKDLGKMPSGYTGRDWGGVMQIQDPTTKASMTIQRGRNKMATNNTDWVKGKHAYIANIQIPKKNRATVAGGKSIQKMTSGVFDHFDRRGITASTIAGAYEQKDVMGRLKGTHKLVQGYQKRGFHIDGKMGIPNEWNVSMVRPPKAKRVAPISEGRFNSYVEGRRTKALNYSRGIVSQNLKAAAPGAAVVAGGAAVAGVGMQKDKESNQRRLPSGAAAAGVIGAGLGASQVSAGLKRMQVEIGAHSVGDHLKSALNYGRVSAGKMISKQKNPGARFLGKQMLRGMA